MGGSLFIKKNYLFLHATCGLSVLIFNASVCAYLIVLIGGVVCTNN